MKFNLVRIGICLIITLGISTAIFFTIKDYLVTLSIPTQLGLYLLPALLLGCMLIGVEVEIWKNQREERS